MKYFLFTCFIFFISFSQLNAQNLHLGGWSAFNRTAYDLPIYESNQTWLTYGARVAFGHQNLQIGGEFETNLTNPSFTVGDSSLADYRREEFNHTYYGGFIRYNSAKVPAHRLGLVLKAGAGLYDTNVTLFDLPEDRKIDTYNYSEKYLGFNASVGISSPIYELLHWELAYQFNYAKVPEMQTTTAVTIPEFNALSHSIQLGISLNFVFGKAAQRAKEVMKSRS